MFATSYCIMFNSHPLLEMTPVVCSRSFGQLEMTPVVCSRSFGQLEMTPVVCSRSFGQNEKELSTSSVRRGA